MGSEDLVCEEGEEGGVSGPRAKEDDAPGFGGNREAVNSWRIQRFVRRQFKDLIL